MNYKPSNFWERVRKDFNLAPKQLHLATFWLSSHPRPVRNSIEHFRRILDENPFSAVNELDDQLSLESRRAIARFCQCDFSEVGLTNSTTDGIYSVLNAFKVQAGDELVTTVHDHYSTQTVLDGITARSGADLIRAKLYNPLETNTSTSFLDEIRKVVTSKTRLLVLTWVHSSSGWRLPMQQIAEWVQQINKKRRERERVLLVVDGTHSIGALPTNLETLGIDVFIASCHKWMLGPRGTGFVWVSHRAADRFSKSIPSFAIPVLCDRMQIPSHQKPTVGELFSTGGFCAFEHRWSIPACVSYLESIGTVAIYRRIGLLNRRLKEQLLRIKGIRLVTPLTNTQSAGITCFATTDRSHEAFAKQLKANGLDVGLSPYKERFLRLSPGIYNGEHEIDMAAQIIKRTIKQPAV